MSKQMSAKKTMTLNLTEKEMRILGELAEKKGLTKTQMMRQALSLYQITEDKLSNGCRMVFMNKETGEEIIEEVFPCPNFPDELE